MKTDELIETYVRLRDKKSQYKAEYDLKVAKVDEALEKIETTLLKLFEDSGSESVRTSYGTAYKQIRFKSNVADWDIALDFIRKNDMWEMLEKRISSKAVESYIEEHEIPPPGVNVRQEVVVNVRRS